MFEKLARLKAIEREYLVVRQAVDRLKVSMSQEGYQLRNGTAPEHLKTAEDRLEDTYLIRLWAEFEVAVRGFYRVTTPKPASRIKAEDLINTVASKRKGRSIDRLVSDPVHAIREYRNSLIHDREVGPPPVGLPVARRDLNIFLGKLIDYDTRGRGKQH